MGGMVVVNQQSCHQRGGKTIAHLNI